MSFAANSRAPKPDPANIPHEPTGPVAADSLAAESLKAQGEFAENPSAVPLGVKGSQSTLATTDTSGASALHPAASGAERERQDALGAGRDERGPSGLKLDAAGKPDFDGSHSALGYAGGPAGDKGGVGSGTTGAAPAGASDFGATTLSSTSASTRDPQIRSGAQFNSSSSTTGTDAAATGGPAAGSGVRPHVPQAPNYTASVTGAAAPEGTYKPKGENLDDADVSESMPAPKTFLGDVGGPHDPGRLAERDFEGRNAQVAGGGVPGGGQQQQQQQAGQGAAGEEGGLYGALKTESA